MRSGPIRYEAVLFDVGGVVLTPADARFEHAVRHVGVNYTACEGQRVVARAVHFAAKTPRPAEFWASDQKATFVAAALGIPHDRSHEFWSVLTGESGKDASLPALWSDVAPDCIETISDLRSMGFKIGLVSNSDGTLSSLLCSSGIDHLFDDVIDSNVVGLAKPDERIFSLAAKRLGVDIATVVFVGDDPFFDLRASQAVGVGLSILLDRYSLTDSLPAENSSSAKISGLGELISLLRPCAPTRKAHTF